MSLSTSPDYLARHGIRASGGPLNGRYVADDVLIHGSWKPPGDDTGVYDLCCANCGSSRFAYRWDGDMEARVSEHVAWQRWANMRMQARLRRRGWKWLRRAEAAVAR